MDDIVFFWNGFAPIFRILVVGSLSFAAIVILLRSAGKRSLASMNAFDFIITITFGSVFGRILTAHQVSFSEAITAFLLLIILQYITAYLQIHSGLLSRLISAQPSLLFYQGEFLQKNIRKARLRKADVISVVRKKGYADLDDIEVIILESDSSFSVIRKTNKEPTHSSLTPIVDQKEQE